MAKPDSARKEQLKLFLKYHKVPSLELALLDQALTHKSYANEMKPEIRPDYETDLYNERLEFLGDAILGSVMAKTLFEKYPGEHEGNLTRIKAQAVCEASLAEIGKALNIGEYLVLGKGELTTGGRTRPSNIANAVEALIGAVFLANGYTKTEKFIQSLWEPFLTDGKFISDSIDYKSRLQELTIQRFRIRPEYRIISSRGPDHNREYHIGLYIRNELMAEASGSSRKKAEQKAARIHLENLKAI